MNNRRLVIDNNTLISRLLLPNSIPAQAVRLAVEIGTLLVSDQTIEELSNVLERSKFDKYVSIEERKQFLVKLELITEKIDIVELVKICRDPKDDKFLEVAINGNAESIITGDKDLLILNPFRKIKIVTPRDFVINNQLST